MPLETTLLETSHPAVGFSAVRCSQKLPGANLKKAANVREGLEVCSLDRAACCRCQVWGLGSV